MKVIEGIEKYIIFTEALDSNMFECEKDYCDWHKWASRKFINLLESSRNTHLNYAEHDRRQRDEITNRH